MIAPFLFAAAAAAQAAGKALQPSAAAQVEAECRDSSSADLVVCGKGAKRYRIDPSVLEAQRAHDAPPPKPPLTAEMSPESGCVGPQACKGGVVPLVGMALVAAKAAALAAEGEDWRDALRTHEDEYRLYQQAEERRAKDRRVKIGVTAGTSR